MTCSSGGRGWPIVPPSENECIWMSAGIVAYRLCDREYDCEHCPLDAALRASATRELPAPRAPAPGQRLRGDCRYSRGHCWVQRRGGTDPGSEVARVGLEPGFAALLLEPHALVMPAVGEALQKDRVHFWVVIEGGTVPVSSPLDGRLRAVNPRMTDVPHELATQLDPDGWLCELDVATHSSEGTLMDAETATRAYARDAVRFRDRVADALRAEKHLPSNLWQDGAIDLRQAARLLGPARYYSILASVYC